MVTQQPLLSQGSGKATGTCWVLPPQQWFLGCLPTGAASWFSLGQVPTEISPSLQGPSESNSLSFLITASYVYREREGNCLLNFCIIFLHLLKLQAYVLMKRRINFFHRLARELGGSDKSPTRCSWPQIIWLVIIYLHIIFYSTYFYFLIVKKKRFFCQFSSEVVAHYSANLWFNESYSNLSSDLLSSYSEGIWRKAPP